MCKDCKSAIIINMRYVCTNAKVPKGIVRSEYKCGSYMKRIKAIYVRCTYEM